MATHVANTRRLSSNCLVFLVLCAASLFDDALARPADEILVAYPGERLSEVATLRFDSQVDWIKLGEMRVDAARYGGVELLPGEHFIEWGAVFYVSFLVNPKMRVEHDFAASVPLEAGHTYTVCADRTTGQGYRTFFWIEDDDTGKIVVGDKKPSRMTAEQARRADLPSDDELARFFDAAGSGDAKTVQSMLDAGFDVRAHDERGRTALMEASFGDRVGVIDLLLEYGADPNARLAPPYGSTAVMVAAATGSEDAVRHLLLDPETDVNARGTEGQTALMYAAINKRLSIVTLLLEHGAEVNARDIRGKTALDWAKGGKTKALLRDTGAKKGDE